MADTPLASKFRIPQARPVMIHRPRLLMRLTTGLRQGARLTLISAPAGYGKTTLAAEWVRSLASPSIAFAPNTAIPEFLPAWLSLDEADNDPVRFTTYLVAALRQVRPDLGNAALFMLQSSQAQALPTVMEALVSDLDNAPEPLILVLDDYHTIHAPVVHEAVALLLDHLPPLVHLLIATRADPPLPIPRLRGQGRLTELRLGDLRFTPQEAASFLETIAGIELLADDLAALNARTEGWPAGLQMAATSMKGADDLSDFVRAFTGSHRHILDYLIGEVLQRQTPEVQAFLLQTSVLDRLCGPLCDAVLGVEESANRRISEHLHPPTDAMPADHGWLHSPFADSQNLLEHLERANLFVIPLDDRREWYRYHRLFADLLNQRLEQTQAELIPTLHRRASEWCAQHGLAESAIEHALAAGDRARAADLVSQEAEGVLMRSEVTTFLRWVASLPEDEIRRRPTLGVYHAWALLMQGSPRDAIEARLASVAAADDAGGRVTLLRAVVALYAGQIPPVPELLRDALARLPEDEPLLRGLVPFILANAYLADGDAAAGLTVLEESARVSKQAGNVMLATLGLCELGDQRQKQGALRQAEALYEQVLTLATDPQGRLLPVAGRALIGLGGLAKERADLEMAQRLLEDGIALCEQWSQMGAFVGRVVLAEVLEARGDRVRLHQTLANARQLAERFDLSQVDDAMVATQEARVAIGEGDLTAARHWATSCGVEQDAASPEPDTEKPAMARMRKYEYPVLARLWLAEGRYQDTTRLMDQLALLAEKSKRPTLLIQAQILKALADQAMGRADDALAAIQRGLALAMPEGRVQLFLDEGKQVLKLLRTARGRLSDGRLASFVDQILAVGAVQFPDLKPIAAPAGAKPVGPLSERELEVLRLLPGDQSTSEIADTLVVSVHTVRSHIKSIYGKLDAHSRHTAVTRARELGLL